jgi:putative DNA primase/helicase
MSALAVSDGDGFGRHIETVSRALLGEPNAAMSKATELRFRTRGSMAVDLEKGAWHDHESGQGGGVLDLIVYQGEAKTKSQAVKWLDAQGIRPANLNTPAVRSVLAETYNYTDADGVLLFQVCRYEPKTFRQRRPDDSARGGWSWTVKGVQQVPFRLPQMLAAPEEIIFIVEGEKDANALAALGLIATCNAGGAGKWPDALAQHFAGRRVVVLPDNDSAGRDHANVVALKLRGIVADVRILELPGLPEKGDVSDWLTAGGDAAELLAHVNAARIVRAPAADVADIHNMQAVDGMSWPHLSDKMQPLNTRPNLQHMLRNYGITARYNVIKKDMVITHPAQYGSADGARAKAVNTILSLCALNRLPKTEATAFLSDIADDHQYNPITEFIQSVRWDGRSRFDDLLATVTTREGFDRDLLSLLMRRWLISAVAAAAKPSGFWSKGVLVFQGDQSLGKTAWFRSLLPDSMRDLVKVDAHIDPANKDSIISAVSHWLVELGELDGTLRKADIARLKGFVSQDVDQFRKPYGSAEEKFQRRTVFFASVNPEQFLADDTGNVRWWTVPVAGIDYEHRIDVQQLWAEVFSWFVNGERWWLDGSEEKRLEQRNAAHQQGDPWHGLIVKYLDSNKSLSSVTSNDVLSEALSIDAGRRTRADQMRVAAVLKHMGWASAFAWKEGRNVRVYHRP